VDSWVIACWHGCCCLKVWNWTCHSVSLTIDNVRLQFVVNKELFSPELRLRYGNVVVGWMRMLGNMYLDIWRVCR
jgi:hypothetical protein